MKKILYFTAALAAITLSSCQKLETDKALQENETVTDAPDFHACFEGQETKAGFTYDASNKEYNHYWEAGDVIYIIRKDVTDGYPLKYACADVAAGIFTYVSEYTANGKVYGTPDRNYAVFGDYYGFNASTKTFTFQPDGNTVVTADKNGAYGYSNQMVAASEDNNLTFKNTHGWLKLQLKGTQKVASIDVESFSGSVPMTGEYYVTYDGTSVPAVDVSGMEEPWRRLSISEPYAQLGESTATDFYIALTPLTLNGIRVTVNFSDGTNEILQKGGIGSSVTIERNMVTPMAVKSVGRSSVDLSATETANCYIVNDAATTYKFKADVKGNSNESIGTPVKADVLWTTQMSAEITPSKNSVIKDVRYIDGYVYFETPDTYVKGNTVIAARDADNNILWSWHIWCPGISDVTTDVDDFSEKGLKFMKHDLGEVDGVYEPLFYEWGRKDSFIRQGINLDNSQKTWPAAAFSIVSGSTTVENAIAHPATFYKNITWQTPVNDQLWKDDEKTIYDPCPAGWRVQSRTGLSKVLTFAQSDAGPYFYYTDYSARIPGGSYSYRIGLGSLSGTYNGGIFKFWIATDGGSYWTSLCEGEHVYSLDRVAGKYQFRMSNIAFSGSGHPVRCMSDKSH